MKLLNSLYLVLTSAVSIRASTITLFDIYVDAPNECHFWIDTDFGPEEGPFYFTCSGTDNMHSKSTNIMYSVHCNAAATQCRVGVFLPLVGYRYADLTISNHQGQGLPKTIS